MKEYSVVGKSLPSLDGRAKATGEAVYTVDMALPQMLCGKTLRSPYPHAQILNIDTSRAERLPGVRAVITGKDFGITLKAGAEPPLAIDKVRYIGEGVAAVAAIDEYIAEEALTLIKVEYKELPAVFDPIEAISDSAPRIHDGYENNITTKLQYNFGDIEKGFRESDYIREDSFAIQSVHPGYMETLVSIANFDSSGKLTLWSSVQVPHLLRLGLANMLQMKLGNIRVIVPTVGGAHCGKNEMLPHHVCSALLSRKADRPVKIELCRDEVFIVNRGSQPVTAELKTGVKKDGTLVATECRIVANFGAYYRARPIYGWLFGIFLTLPYTLPNLRYEGYMVYTNNAIFAAQRGSGVTPAHFIQDMQLDMIASDLGIDPVEIRLRNAARAGYVSASGLKANSCGLAECIQKVAERSGWKEKRGKLSVNRGLGIVCYSHPSGGSGIFNFDSSAAFVHVHEDGTVTLITGSTDMGQGSSTVFPQIAAEELGVALEDIRMISQDTEIGPFDMGSLGSRAGVGVGNAVRLAAADAKQQVLEEAAERLGARVEDLEARERRIYVKQDPSKGIAFVDVVRDSLYSGKGKIILGKGYYNEDVDAPNMRTGEGNMAISYSFGAQVAEVEVDTETGQVMVCKATMAHDIGFALNPMNVEGQLEGQLQAGIGQALYEERLTEGGRVANPSFIDYRMPRSLDMPQVETILIETHDAAGPFGAKECGEGPTGAVAPAIANAIYDAIGVRVNNFPITPEKVLKALKEKI